MAIDQTATRSRRAILVAGLGGLAASVASAIGRPQVVRAGSDGDLVLGADNNATFETNLTNTAGGTALLASSTASGSGLHGISDSGSGVAGSSTSGPGVSAGSSSGLGVYATSSTSDGVRGITSSGNGVSGYSSAGYGVYGKSTNQVGVYGEAASHPGVVGTSTNSIGVSGTSPNSTGVAGSSGIGTGVNGHSNATNRAGTVGQSDGDSTGVMGLSGVPLSDAPAKTGVYGEAAQDASARGVWGKSASGRGVFGEATTGFGVRGQATSGTGVYASTGGLKKGLAIHAVGRVRLDNSVGIATIASGTKSVVVTPGIDLTATSAVVATIQGAPSGSMTVRSVAVDAAADTFTIYLTANATVTMTVAWHVFG